MHGDFIFQYQFNSVAFSEDFVLGIRFIDNSVVHAKHVRIFWMNIIPVSFITKIRDHSVIGEESFVITCVPVQGVDPELFKILIIVQIVFDVILPILLVGFNVH